MAILFHIPGYIGRLCLAVFIYWLDLIAFCNHAMSSWVAGAKGLNKANLQSLYTQIIFTGIGALPIVLLLAIATAVVFTAPIMHLSSEVGRNIDITGRLTHIICFEIAPLLTALVLVSRSGSAITVDIGNMKLRGEIDGLTLLAIDIKGYIVAPRLFAGMISQLMLAIYFSFVALYGGILIAGLLYSQQYLLAVDDALLALSPQMIILFVIKNSLFGLVVCGAACFQALQIESCVTQLPQHTQKAIVRALSLIFTIDLLMLILS